MNSFLYAVFLKSHHFQVDWSRFDCSLLADRWFSWDSLRFSQKTLCAVGAFRTLVAFPEQVKSVTIDAVQPNLEENRPENPVNCFEGSPRILTRILPRIPSRISWKAVTNMTWCQRTLKETHLKIASRFSFFADSPGDSLRFVRILWVDGVEPGRNQLPNSVWW